MTPLAHESNEPSNGNKVEHPIITVQIQDVPQLTPSLYRPEVDTSAIDPRKLKRKVDFRLLPWLTLLYLMNYLDRGSIGNARVCTLRVHTSCISSCTLHPPIAV